MGARLVALLCLFALTGVAAQPRLVWRIDHPPALAAVASRIEAMNAAALARALEHAGLTLPADVHVRLLGREEALAQAVPAWVVGSAFGSDRMVIYPERIGDYPYGSLESVVLHELAHLALAAQAGGQPLPRWFHEGVAVSVESGWGVGSQLRLLLAAQRDPAIDDVDALFASDQLPATTSAYLLSAALVHDLRQRFGADVPGRIGSRIARGAEFDQAFLHETGETPAQAAAAAWRMYRGIRWLPALTGPSGIWSLILALAVVAFVVRVSRRRQRRRRWDIEEQQADEGPPADDP